MDLWTPAAGKKIAVTHVIVGSAGTTQGRLVLWFGANGDTTYSAGTDQPVADITFSPSASATPGWSFPSGPLPIPCNTADYRLKVTTDAALTLGIVVYGYEF